MNIADISFVVTRRSDLNMDDVADAFSDDECVGVFYRADPQGEPCVYFIYQET